MNCLIFGPGPRLVWQAVGDHSRDSICREDVTGFAAEFLFEPVTLHPDVTLGDLFKLLDACAPLKQVFRRAWAVELCREARKGPLQQIRGKDPAPVGGIEYLELYWAWQLDSSSRTYLGVHHLDLRGIGHALSADGALCGAKAGERIEWCVSLTPVRELLKLPLRLQSELIIWEDDIDARAYAQEIAFAKCPEALLGQVILGVLEELSCHGGPVEQAEFRQKLDAQLAEIDAGLVELDSCQDVFANLDRPGLDALFETLGSIDPGKVSLAMRRIGDNELAGPFLSAAFDGEVVVKKAFRDRPGREFRKAFRAAAR